MQKAVEIISRNQTIRGMINAPDQIDGKLPAIIILHGFGGNKMGPHFMFVKFSRTLSDIGFASIRFDFAGSGESNGEFVDMTLSGELEDAENILKYVKSLDFVDSDRIGVVGFSMGGAVASMLAGIHGKDIQSLCLWSPAGNIAEIVINDFIGQGYSDFLRNGCYEYDSFLIGKKFVDDIKKTDVYSIASGYEGNILLLHGSDDEVVPLDASLKYLDTYGDKAKLTIIDGADHLFSKNSWKQELIEHTVEFFKQESLERV